MTDIAKIASGLSEGARDKLVYGYRPILGWANVSVNGAPTYIPELVERHLLTRATDLDGKPHFCAYDATPLGLAVRNHLQGQSHAE